MPKKIKAPAKENKEKPKTYKFKVSLAFRDDLYSASADSIYESLEEISKMVRFVKNKAVLIVESDGKMAQKNMFVPEIKRMLVNNTAKLIVEKLLLQILK